MKNSLLLVVDVQRNFINENTKRQAAESDIAERAMQQESRLTADSDSVIIAVGEGWHHGS